MTFDSTRLQENPGKIFPVQYRDGTTGRAHWTLFDDADATRKIISLLSDGRICAHDANGNLVYATKSGSEVDIVAYAPRTEERWFVVNSEGSLGSVAYNNRAEAERTGYAVARARITVIDEEV